MSSSSPTIATQPTSAMLIQVVSDTTTITLSPVQLIHCSSEIDGEMKTTLWMLMALLSAMRCCQLWTSDNHLKSTSIRLLLEKMHPFLPFGQIANRKVSLGKNFS